MRERPKSEGASVGNRAPPHGGGESGGVLSSAGDDDGGDQARCASVPIRGARASNCAPPDGGERARCSVLCGRRRRWRFRLARASLNQRGASVGIARRRTEERARCSVLCGRRRRRRIPSACASVPKSEARASGIPSAMRERPQNQRGSLRNSGRGTCRRPDITTRRAPGTQTSSRLALMASTTRRPPGPASRQGVPRRVQRSSSTSTKPGRTTSTRTP